MNQYYSERILQKRGQEIVDKSLEAAIKMAMVTFKQKQPGNELPDHFVIYRDGVGDAMRKQVLQQELSQFRSAIESVYNKAAKKPYITLVIVNKRITQRFFVEDNRGGLDNPPSGCVIDRDLVENSDSEMEYDFFLIPQFTT